MKILFRFDASGKIGVGHLSRCLVLAKKFKVKNFEPLFITKNYDSFGPELIKESGFKNIKVINPGLSPKEDFEYLKNITLKYRPDLIIVDSYNLDLNYYKKVKKLEPKFLLIDDFGKSNINADFILNQNIYAKKILYSKCKYLKLFLGPKFALIKGDFISKRKIYKVRKNVKNLLITFGGGKGINKEIAMLKIIDALKGLSGKTLNIRIVGNFAHSIKDKLEKTLRSKDFNYKLRKFSKNIADDFLWSDLVICGGGVTCYELCAMGVPFLTVIFADNQKLTAKFLDKNGISINLGWYNKLSPLKIRSRIKNLIYDFKKRKAVYKNGRALVDGLGAERALEGILN